jgi:uncharacterized Zn-finger protein
MNLKRIYQVVLVLWFISAVVMIFLLDNIDSIIHGDLYNYGLQMSTEWANPYWTYLRLIYVMLGVPMVVSLLAIVAGFWMTRERVAASVTKQPQWQQKPKRVVCETPKLKEEIRSSDETREDGSMVISCPTCKKVFSRPLVMLNFEGGKTKLVNVCPYCNRVLGSAENGDSSNIDFHIADSHKRLTP